MSWCRCRRCFHRRKRLQMKARTAVQTAIRRGDLPYLDGSIQCSDCSDPAEQYEHRDYRKPLAVFPVCLPCNLRRGAAAPFNGLRDPLWRYPRPGLVVDGKSLYRRQWIHEARQRLAEQSA